MKNFKSILLIIVIIIVQMFLINTCRGQSSIVVNNHTPYKVDKLIQDALTILQIKDVVVFVRETDLNTLYTTNKATVIEKSNNHVYFLYIDKNTKEKEIKHIIIHECIHIFQMYRDRLVQIDKYNVIFDGVKINLLTSNYYNRKYEIEAEMLIIPLLRQIKLCNN